MPPPPPPGPPAPPPPGPAAQVGASPFKSKSAGGGDRKALLNSIQKGTHLKKTVTNDRSAPIVGSNKNNGAVSASVRGVGQNQGASQGDQGGSGGAPGPLPGIGGLFAGGMPTLKKTVGGVQTGRSTSESKIIIGSNSNNIHIID